MFSNRQMAYHTLVSLGNKTVEEADTNGYPVWDAVKLFWPEALWPEYEFQKCRDLAMYAWEKNLI